MRVALLAAMLLGAAPAVAQTADEIPTADGVVITGELEKTIERARDFVDAAAGRWQSGQLPRWDGSVCLAFYGLSSGQEAYFGDAIRDVGSTVGIPLGLGTTCDRIAIILFSDESNVLLKRIETSGVRVLYGWNRHRRRLMAESAAPVRWLARAGLVPARGGTAAEGAAPGGLVFSSQAGGGPPVISGGYASRLAPPTRADQRTMVMLVDAEKIAGATNRALAAYLAMVVLAGPDQRQATPAPSILQLFDAGVERPDALTAWDRAYLSALYASAPDTHAFFQEREIARRMARSLLKLAEE